MEEAPQAVYEEHRADSDGTGADAGNVDAYGVEDSGNYVSIQDCSGHEAEFAWVQQNNIGDDSDAAATLNPLSKAARRSPKSASNPIQSALLTHESAVWISKPIG